MLVTASSEPQADEHPRVSAMRVFAVAAVSSFSGATEAVTDGEEMIVIGPGNVARRYLLGNRMKRAIRRFGGGSVDDLLGHFELIAP
jgi:hypothetical protein